MYYTGFADEAGASIDTQIKATKELGWSNIESRNIDGVNIHDLPEEQFEQVCEKLAAADVKINCFGSEIANWSRDVRKEEDVRKSMEQMERAIPRMQKLGCSMVRGMSFSRLLDQRPDTDDVRKLVVENVSKLVKMCEDAGLLYLQENCMNFGGLSQDHTRYLLDNIPSPALKLVYDTGNPVNTWDYREYPPVKKQDSWDFYKDVKEFVHYVHIKDCIYKEEGEGIFPVTNHQWPGEGNGHVRKIVADLLASGYDGGFSIEPHMGAVYHDPSIKSDDEAKYSMYVEYGRRFMKMVEEIRAEG